MKPGNAYWTLVAPIWNSITVYDFQQFIDQFAAAPLKARTLYAAHFCQSEVYNGGFHQFFFNSTGVLAPEAADSFQVIGMPRTSALVLEAMAWFGEPYPRERRQRQKKLGTEPGKKQFERIDTDFFALWKTENGGFLAAADKYALAS